MSKWNLFVVIMAFALLTTSCSDDSQPTENTNSIKSESSEANSQTSNEVTGPEAQKTQQTSETTEKDPVSQKTDFNSNSTTEKQAALQSQTINGETPNKDAADILPHKDKVDESEVDSSSAPYISEVNPILDMQDTDAFIYLLAPSNGNCDKKVNYSKQSCALYIKKVMSQDDRWYHIISHYKIQSKHFHDQRIYTRMHKELKHMRSANSTAIKQQYGLKTL